MGANPQVNRPLNYDDRAMLEGLVRTDGPRLLAYVRRAFGPLDAEDVVAETFCRAAARIDGLWKCERRDLYLLTIARNIRRDGFRRRRPAPASQQFLDSLPSALSEPNESIERAERRRVVNEALARLSDSQREIIALRFSAELKFDEIATLLDIPLGTALSRAHAALGQLRERIGHVYDG